MAKRTVKKPATPGPAKKLTRPRAQARIKKQQEIWLRTYGEGATRNDARTAAGISRTTFYRWLETYSGFRQAVEDARGASTEKLEDEAIRRAMSTSDTMLIFMLKARDPATYRERYDVNTKVAGSMDLTHQEIISLSEPRVRGMTTEKLQQARGLFMELLGEGESNGD